VLNRKLAAFLVLVTSVLAYAQSRTYKPVTDEMLRHPSADDWLHWRGTSDAWGYSALKQINRSNVSQLQMVWGWAMDPGMQETTPIVHDGVMYVAGPGDKVIALDAVNGELLWEYRREMPSTPRGVLGQGHAVRNIAIYSDKVFLNTGDAHVVALDARTGNVVWDTQTADRSHGFMYEAGPLVVQGKVISGLQGCDKFYQEKCAITALDSESGKELWRTTTIAQPDDPAAKTWGDVSFLYRAGGDMWLSGSYNNDTNLIYWPVDQAKPWTRAARGTDGAALYTDSTLALDPGTGKIVWYHQYVPGESHDMDDSFENIIVDVNGRKSVFEMGKLGILWQIDAKTGGFIRATDLGYQNLLDVDRKTGEASYRPGVVPKLGEESDFCPSFGGVKSWRSMSYHPETRAFYIPVELTCQQTTFVDVKKVPGGGGVGQGKRINVPHPASGGNLGEFLAMDTSGEVLWKHRQRAPFNTAALTTAGGLVFVGDWNRYIDAYDVKTGELLWQTRTVTSPQGFPITYAVNGRQYIAVPIGVNSLSWGSTIPLALSPEIKRPNSGNAIVVYALPESREAMKARLTAATTPYSVPAAAPRSASGSSITVWDAVYSEAQAARGKETYVKRCASCHQEDLTGGSAPALKGNAFIAEWNNRSIGDLFGQLDQTMPVGGVGSLSSQEYLDIVAFMLKANNFPSGKDDLGHQVTGLDGIKIVSRK